MFRAIEDPWKESVGIAAPGPGKGRPSTPIVPAGGSSDLPPETAGSGMVDLAAKGPLRKSCSRFTGLMTAHGFVQIRPRKRLKAPKAPPQDPKPLSSKDS